MRQTTLFDNQVKVLNKTEFVSNEAIESKEITLRKVAYKPSSVDNEIIPGFDISLKDWIYPINFPVRDYQLQIVQECLFKNTLVCLPTGLGKTFIASVTMYNFYRWYPRGKIIFVAPTRPLVHQQMYACRDTIPINPSDFIEMTGSINQNLRINFWEKKRVFFLTAQVLVNDLQSKICPGKDIVFLVLDEAHKATKNHSYCQVIRELTGEIYNNRSFRVLGLSATPGNDIITIQQVIQNLLISHIELRTDECKDIQKYSHERLVEEIIVPLGSEVTNIRDKLLQICNPMVERLKLVGGINNSQTISRLTKYGLLKMRDEFKASKGGGYRFQSVYADFAQLISLFYAVELVQQHGIKPTFLYFANAIANCQSMPQIVELMNNNEFMQFYEELEKKLDPSAFITGHPKLSKLQDIIKNHFINKTPDDQKSSRVIVFSQIRDSVEEIIRLLKEMEPLIRPIAFMGKTKQVSQRQQMEAMRLFADGTANVLVSTCIGEEGLDIGEVDLIICFDTQKSPIRLIQRAGRTGRKREGRVVMLLSEGKEVSNYHTSLSKKSRIHSAIFEGYKHLVFYPDNPRMVPLGLDPIVNYQEVKIVKQPRLSPVKKPRKSLHGVNPVVDTCIFSGSQQPILDTTLFCCEAMRFLGETHDTTGRTFSSRYSLVNYKSSFYRTQPSPIIGGHSSVTRNFVAVLRLKEMHRRGDTNIIFHLSTSRLVDIDAPFIEEHEQKNILSQTVSDIEDHQLLEPPPLLNQWLARCADSLVLAPFSGPVLPPPSNTLIKKLLVSLESTPADLIGQIEAQQQNLIFKETDIVSKQKTLLSNETNIASQISCLASNETHIESDQLSPSKSLESKLVNEQLPQYKSLIFKEPPLLLEASPMALCTSTPMKSLLSSFHVHEKSRHSSDLSRSRFQSLISTFNVPSVYPYQEPNLKQLFDGTQIGFGSVLQCFQSEANLKLDLSSDLFGDIDEDLNKPIANDDDDDLFLDLDESLQALIDVKEVSHKPPESVNSSLFTSFQFPDSVVKNSHCGHPVTFDSDDDLFSEDLSLLSPVSSHHQDDISGYCQDLSKANPISTKTEESKGLDNRVIEVKNMSLSSNSSGLSDSFLEIRPVPLECQSRSPSFSFSESECIEGDNGENPSRFLNIRHLLYSQAAAAHSGSDEEDADGPLEASFIDDDINESGVIGYTQMHQVYLESLKSNSPLFGQGLDNLPQLDKELVCSQPLTDDDDYILDSFVIPDNYKTPPRRKRPPRHPTKNETSPIMRKRFKRLVVLDDSLR